MLKQQTKLRVRLYARLSKDDGDADKESNSITNQLQMLRYNAKEKGFEVIGEYVDDGYSGTTFNRPDLNRMIKDAMDDPEPSGIMVKDMSRFGRNNAMFMYYVEEIFPNNDILFIALNDDVDTRFDENEMMPFKSIMKNISHSGKVSNDFSLFGRFCCINRCFRCSCGKFSIVHGVQAAIGFLAAAIGEKGDLPETHPVQQRTESRRPCRSTHAKPASKGLGRALSV